MGCGGSKAVAVEGAAPEKRKPEADPVTKDAVEGEGEDCGATEIVPLKEKSKSFAAFEIVDDEEKASPKPMPKHLAAKMEKQKQARQKSIGNKSDVEKKIQDAEKRREEELKIKTERLKQEDAKRQAKKREQIAKKKKEAEKLENKQEAATEIREKHLEEKKQVGEVEDEKAKKARVRRHEMALQEANQIEAGGENDDCDENEPEEGTTADGNTETW
eukprot:m.1341226 g.1341226  ORF g.1341226 m.1341226 type:complete len:217 (-) comp24893_c0_seq3:4138-4788(-)